jgi:transposase-like protein
MIPAHIRVVAQRASRSRYWREADARPLLAALSDSGLSVTDFAREFGIHASRIERWQRRLAAHDGTEAPVPPALEPLSFHPIHVVVDEPSSSGLELVLRNGRRIAVREGFDPRVLERLICVLEELPC